MSYQVLARKYRPRTFAEVVGQDHVTRTLKNAMRQERLAHAFLFTGPRGVGKTSTARILARAVNCPNVDLKGDCEPCNVCETCRALFEDRELDVIEMDAATHRGIEDVRSLSQSARLAPVAGNKKIYIIDEVHMFTKEAFNAFLKTLEEPPAHVLFILATTDAQRLPGTILSRVQRFDFRPLGPQDIAPHLKKICASENWPCDEEALWIIARAAQGSLRDAEGLLDQVVSFSGGSAKAEETREVLGVLPQELLARTTALLAERNLAEVPPFFELMVQRGVDYTEFLRAIQGFWLDIVFLKQDLDVPGKSPEEIEQMKACSASFQIEDIFRLMRLAEQLEDALKWSVAPRERFEVAFMRWMTLDRVVTIRDLMDSMGKAPETPAIPAKSRPPVQAGNPSGKQTPTVAPPTLPPVQEGKSGGSENTVVTPSLDQIVSRWSEIIAKLVKSTPMIAASAGTWEPVALTTGKLSVRCNSPRDLPQKHLREQLANIAKVVEETLGFTVTVLADKSTPKPVEEAPREQPAAITPAPDAGDTMSLFHNRFGNVEVDPKTVRQPK